MAVSLGTMDWISGGVIAALVILNVSVGSYTEWQAEKVSQQSYPLGPMANLSDRRISRVGRSTTSDCHPSRRRFPRASH